MHTSTATDSKTRIQSIEKQIGEICAQINSINQYIDSNRYDRESVRDAEKDLHQLEIKLHDLQNQRATIQSEIKTNAPAQRPVRPAAPKRTTMGILGNGAPLSQQADIFARTYLPEHVQIDEKIKELKHEYILLESRQYSLEDQMFACEINMDKTCRTADVVSQASADIDFYADEYANISIQMKKIENEIRDLRARRKQLSR